MEKFAQLKMLVDAIESDVGKFYEKGNKTAGIRVRTAFNQVKKLAQEIRLEVTEIKNKTL